MSGTPDSTLADPQQLFRRHDLGYPCRALNALTVRTRGTEGLQTQRWRELDPNPRSRRAGDGCMAPGLTGPE